MDEEHQRKIDEQKAIFDEVTKEWLDDKYATFGRWTAKTLLAVVFIFFLRAIVHLNAADLRSVLETASQAHNLTQ